jgi:hypothetical protein
MDVQAYEVQVPHHSLARHCRGESEAGRMIYLAALVLAALVAAWLDL